MKEKLIKFETAKIAKEKGFNLNTPKAYNDNGVLVIQSNYPSYIDELDISAPTQSLLQKWIRETRGIHIEIHRNASGWFWSMCKSESGTDLGYSKFSGPNDSGVWDEHDDALENALQVQLSYDLPNSLDVIKHWGNYVELAIETFRNMAI